MNHQELQRTEKYFEDRNYCEHCRKYRFKSKREVYQVKRDEACVYACRQCDQTVLEGDMVPPPGGPAPF